MFLLTLAPPLQGIDMCTAYHAKCRGRACSARNYATGPSRLFFRKTKGFRKAVITADGVGAEIKGTKTVKGVIKPIADEPGFYRFESALDKNGNPVDFDFALIAAGQTVKVSAK